MDIIKATKKAVKELIAKGYTKEQLINILTKMSSVHRTINYSARYGLSKEMLIEQRQRRDVLKNPSLIGL